MTALTTRQRDLLQLLLDARSPLAAADMARQMHLSPRQVSYGLQGLKRWLAQKEVFDAARPFIPHQLQQPVDVSRTTVLSDLDALEPWLAAHNLRLERRPNDGKECLPTASLSVALPSGDRATEKCKLLGGNHAGEPLATGGDHARAKGRRIEAGGLRPFNSKVVSSSLPFRVLRSTTTTRAQAASP